ncbi:MAG: hypothetical protein HY696_10585 [Deltaproteobacteria bacterium]|nr:hypothetical protein [Deltaproteobacteria bacterium]
MKAPVAIRTSHPSRPKLAPRDFHRPLAISARHPLLGFDLPIIAQRPLVAQPAAAALAHPLLISPLGTSFSGLSPERSTAEGLLRDALEAVATDPEQAGSHFHAARVALERTPRDLNHLSPLYVAAVLGEATYDQGDAETARALRDVKHYARTSGDQELLAKERLTRAVLLTRWGQEEDAASVLAKFARDNAPRCSTAVRVAGLIHYSNLLMNRAVRYQDASVRTQALASLRHIFLQVLPGLIADNEDLPESVTETLPKLYYFIADFFLQQGRSRNALEMLWTARVHCSDEQIEALFTAEEEAQHGDEDGVSRQSALRRLVATQMSGDALSFGHRLYAWGAEFLPRARFKDNRAFCKVALLGATTGAAAVATLGAVAGEPQSVADIMVGSAAGATGAVGLGKALIGLAAEEPWQALETGYTERTIGLPLLKEAAKLVTTFALFGGPIPGLESLLPSVLVAGTEHGGAQLHGVGSALSYLVERVATHSGELGGFLSQHGFPDGVAAFWQSWVDQSVFAEGLHNGFTFPFGDNPLGQLFGNADFGRFSHFLDEWCAALPSAARTVVEGAVYGYMGLGGTYAFASMSPHARQWMEEQLGKDGLRRMEKALFPGALFATVAAMMASGMTPQAALGLALTSYAVQARLILQGGGLSGVDIGKMMRAGAIQLLYLAPGAALMPELASAVAHDPNAPLLDRVGTAIEAHFGIVWFMAMLGGAHAVLTGLNPSQTLMAKFAKAATWEIPVQVIKILFGWLSFWGNTVALLLKEAGFGAITSSSIREAGGSSVQGDIVRSRTQPLRAIQPFPELPRGLTVDLPLRGRMRDEAEAFHRDGVNAAMVGEAMEFHAERFASQPLEVQLPLVMTAYFLREDARLQLRPRLPLSMYYRVVYRALTDAEVPAEVVADYLERLKVVVCDADPDLADVRRNLLIATMRAAVHPTHGARLRAFFGTPDGESILQQYALQPLYTEALKYRHPEHLPWKVRLAREAWQPKRWITSRLSGPPEQALYDAAVVAGRRIRITGPFAGRTVREAGAAFFTMFDSITQTDVAHQTRADPSFYYGTLWKQVLMRPKGLRGLTDTYRKDEVAPLLEAIRRIAGRVHDVRADIRHNLLLTVELASQGPHAEMIQQFIAQNKPLFTTMHEIRGSVLAPNEHLPRGKTLKDLRMTKRLFRRLLVDSGNSADGMLVDPLVRVSPFDTARAVASTMGRRDVAPVAARAARPAVTGPVPKP